MTWVSPPACSSGELSPTPDLLSQAPLWAQCRNNPNALSMICFSLHPRARRARSTPCRRPGCTTRRAIVRASAMRCLPRAGNENRRLSCAPPAWPPGHPPLHRLVVARHGRRASRRQAGFSRGATRLAHSSPMGHWPEQQGQRQCVAAARWPRAQSNRSDPVAWRRSSSIARRVCPNAEGGARGFDHFPEFPLAIKS